MSQHEKGRHCLYYYSLCDNTLLTVGITTAIDVSGANEVFSTDPDPVLSLTLPPNTELKPIFILGVFMYMSTSKQASVKAKLKLKVPLTTYIMSMFRHRMAQLTLPSDKNMSTSCSPASSTPPQAMSHALENPCP